MCPDRTPAPHNKWLETDESEPVANFRRPLRSAAFGFWVVGGLCRMATDQVLSTKSFSTDLPLSRVSVDWQRAGSVAQCCRPSPDHQW
jgi:hypothetical protein